MQITDKSQTFMQHVIAASKWKSAMRSRTGDCCTIIALTLAAAAAILSAPGQADNTYQTLQWLLATSAATEAATVAGAIGERSETFVSP
jgi:hypothetical protein